MKPLTLALGGVVFGMWMLGSVLYLGAGTAYAAGDADGCPDVREQQTAPGSELSGGRRDYLKSWDYFNPTHDGVNRTDDITAVVVQYGQDDDDANPGLPPYAPGYTPTTDRTYVGPNAWNLGPPNGLQRTDDITNAVKQFGHDCELPYSHSWYVTSDSATAMYNRGRDDGMFDNATCTDSLVVLNFGQPDYQSGTYGTNYFAPGFPFISDLEIIFLAEEYARGWFGATGFCPRLHVVVGTNNYDFDELVSGGGTPYTAGSTWADVVDAVQDYLEDPSRGYDWQITAWAGSDMEQPGGGEDWDCADRTRQFVDGYNANANATVLLNYGTAWVPNPCWTTYDVYYVSYGAALNWPLPEIYTGPATDSWVSIRQSYFMVFKGVMTTCQQGDPLPAIYCTDPSGWFAPSGAQWDLYKKLDANGVGQDNFGYSTNIKFQ